MSSSSPSAPMQVPALVNMPFITSGSQFRGSPPSPHVASPSAPKSANRAWLAFFLC